MMTVKDLVTSDASTSPDGVHWEPAIPLPWYGWRFTWRDAWEVLNSRAVAIRQTTMADLVKQPPAQETAE